MTLTPSNISSKRIKRNVKRVGRGNGSGKGTYSARGMKGQRARSGGKRGLLKKAMKAQLQKIPKSRGFNTIATKAETVSLATLERVAEVGVDVTPFFLKKKGVVKNPRNGAKIVATGTLTKKLTLKNCLATKTAVVAIEKVGGTLSV
ncbi:MAG: 50S ribosomal protein L15 [Candidatus Magasanikbacteria bacterium]|nr:50S ribosomal protein L15 [Candidatus Magasanikbacteria bacterium]